MFVAERDQVLDTLGRMGAKVCCYCWGGEAADWLGTRCDCKYGAEHFAQGVSMVGGEQTGCPELRAVYEIVAAMPDDIWKLLAMRGGSVVTDAEWHDALWRALSEHGFAPPEDES